MQLPLSMSVKMKTKVIEIKENEIASENVELAAKYLKEGKLVAFPTETVYGIGANALSADAAANIYKAKGRPSDNPLIVHLADFEQLADYVNEISEKAKRLAEAFWPGPLTMIFCKKDKIPSTITGNLDTVGIRIPAHPIARAVLKACGLPIAAPSANISGRPSPTVFEHVLEDLDGRVDMIIHAGSAQVGLESTVIDMTKEVPVILRPGAITKEMIEAVIGTVLINRGNLAEKEIPMAPGMKYRHYAPKGQLFLLEGDFAEVLSMLRERLEQAKKEGKKAAAMVPSQYKEELSGYLCFDLGNGEDLEMIARKLFDGLRFMDVHRIEEIYSPVYPETGIGEAIMNRLRKAAGAK